MAHQSGVGHPAPDKPIRWTKDANPYVLRSNRNHLVTFATIEARDAFLLNWREKHAKLLLEGKLRQDRLAGTNWADAT